MTECTQIEWAARTAAWLGEGDAILGAPRRNVLGTTALTPPVLADRGPIMTYTFEAEAPESVDIRQALDDMEAFQVAQAAARQRYVEVLTETAAGLFRPKLFWATRIEPTDRRRS